MVSCSLGFIPLPASRDRPELNPASGYVRMWGKCDFKYNLERVDFPNMTTAKILLITIEDCYFYLRPKMSRSGVHVARYGSGWSNIIIGGDSYIQML